MVAGQQAHSRLAVDGEGGGAGGAAEVVFGGEGARRRAGSEDYAVVLNAAARRVSERVVSELSDLVPPDRLHVVRTFEEGDDVCRELVSRRVGTVFTGGGDGTVTHFVNRALHHVETTRHGEMPDIGILRLGTGNALAEMVSSRDFRCDLKNFMGNPHRDLHELPLIEAEGRRFPFAGVGWDAELLNDYTRLKEQLASPLLRPLVQNVGGYFAALFAYTIPRRVLAAMRSTSLQVRVVNLGSPAARLDAAGRVVDVLPSGEVLYEGPANCAMVGTCPYYGYGMKVLPWANLRKDRMQLRIATMSLGSLLGQLPSVWRGAYRGPGMLDLLVDRVRFEFVEPTSYQEAGDARGMRESVELSLDPKPLRLLRFI